MAPKDLIRQEKNTPQLPEGQLVWIPPGFALSTESPEAQQQESHLWDYIWMIWRKRWLVLLMFLICVSVAALQNYKAIPIYQAYAKLRISPEEPKLITFQGEQMSVGYNHNEDFINTQLQVISGRKIAQQTMEKLGFFKNAGSSSTQEAQAVPAEPPPSELAKKWNNFVALVGLAPDVKNPFTQAATANSKEMDDILQQLRIKGFLMDLTVAQVKETEVVQVSYLSSDPQFCAKVVNTLCDEYIKWTYESKDESLVYARNFLKTKLDEMKGKLEQSENDLIKLTGGADFVGSPDGQLPQQLETYRQKIVDSERELFQKQFDLQRYSGDKNFGALRSLGDPQLGILLDKYATDEIERDKLKAANMGEKSKEMLGIKAEMSRIEVQLQEAQAQVKKKAQFEYDQVKANHDYLQKMFDSEKARTTGIQKNMIQYNILKREVETNRDLFNSLLQRSKEVNLTSGVKAGYASVIEPALPPMAPSFPNKPRTLALGALLGLFLGIGLVFFLDYMDTSVKDPEELERIARLPILGCVSHCDVKRAKGESRVSVEMLTHFRPRSEFAESIRSIRTSIQYSRAGGSPKTILVTSCLPAEGKTTISTNLAIALASRNKTVLLIDADLKKPSLNKLFNVDRKLGLSEVLTGAFDGSNLPETEIKNLFVMPAGSKPPNPVELLDSEAMAKFLEKAANEYDHVIVDCAPSLNMADSSVIAPLVDGVLMVVQPGKTPREAVRRVKERLVDVQGNVLGMVMNNPTKSAGQRYGSRYGYGYGYGYGKRYGYGHEKGFGQRFGGENESEATAGRVKEIVDISPAARQINPQDEVSE